MVSVIFSLNNHTWSTNEKQKEKRNKSKKKKKTARREMLIYQGTSLPKKAIDHICPLTQG